MSEEAVGTGGGPEGPGPWDWEKHQLYLTEVLASAYAQLEVTPLDQRQDQDKVQARMIRALEAAGLRLVRVDRGTEPDGVVEHQTVSMMASAFTELDPGLKVWTAIDEEGNGYNAVYFTPTAFWALREGLGSATIEVLDDDDLEEYQEEDGEMDLVTRVVIV